MISLHKALIKGFDFPYFTIAMAFNENMQDLQISNQLGIRSADFIAKCKHEFQKFSKENEYSQRTCEKYFGVRFNKLRVVKGEIFAFTEKPLFSLNVIYIHEKWVTQTLK